MDSLILTPIIWVGTALAWLALGWVTYRLGSTLAGKLKQAADSPKTAYPPIIKWVFIRFAMILVVFIPLVWWTTTGIDLYRPRNEPPENQQQEMRLDEIDNSKPLDPSTIKGTPTPTNTEKFEERKKGFEEDAQAQKDRLADS